MLAPHPGPSPTVGASPVGRLSDDVNREQNALNGEQIVLTARGPHASGPGQDGEQAPPPHKKRKLKCACEDAPTPGAGGGPPGSASAGQKRKAKEGSAAEAECGGSGRPPGGHRPGGDRRGAPAGDGEGGEGGRKAGRDWGDAPTADGEGGASGPKSKKRKAESAPLAAKVPKKTRDGNLGSEDVRDTGVEPERASSDVPFAAGKDGPARLGGASTPAPNQIEGQTPVPQIAGDTSPPDDVLHGSSCVSVVVEYCCVLNNNCCVSSTGVVYHQ